MAGRVELGLDQRIAVPRDSYLVDYFNDVSDTLRVGPPVFFVVESYDYADVNASTRVSYGIGSREDSLLNQVRQRSGPRGTPAGRAGRAITRPRAVTLGRPCTR